MLIILKCTIKTLIGFIIIVVLLFNGLVWYRNLPNENTKEIEQFGKDLDMILQSYDDNEKLKGE